MYLEVLREEGTLNLPDYQSRVIDELLKKNTFERAAEIWAEYSYENTSPFTSQNTNKSNYIKEIRSEFKKFVCGDVKYENNRKEVESKIGLTNNEVIIASISSWIGNEIGLAGSFVAPIIVLLLKSLSVVSLNAWCNLQE